MSRLVSLFMQQQSWSTTLGISVRGYAGGGYANIAEHEKGKTKISGYFNTGFAVNNVQIPGSIVATSDMYLMWKPRRMEEVTPDSLVFLELLNPRPEILVLGCGKTVQQVPKSVTDYLKGLGVVVEVLDSRNATGYFNVLNDDGRVVVGALLAMDPNAALPEVMPEIKNPVIDAGLSKTNKVV